MRALVGRLHLLLLFFLCVTPSLGLDLFDNSFIKEHVHVKRLFKGHENAVKEANTASQSDQSLAPIPVNNVLPRELLRRADSGQSSSATSGDYTCGPNKPCGNKACCGESGWCGYEPKYCGKGCQSNCDAKAECGKYAAKPGQICPLNVCCSEFGFCGTTEEFCKKGCQSKCTQPKPSGGKSNVQQKIIAYWEAWNENKPCGHMTPQEIPVHDITHLIFSFGFISPGDFKITNMADVKPSLFKEVAQLKDKNPNLSIMIALGGWTHNDPGKYQKVFSDMVSSASNRKIFINNLLGFLSQYGYDGVDFDWEYPGADDRGGKDSDGKNYTQFLKELQASIKGSGKSYIVTYTAPTSYWYLRHFDLKAMNQYVDWINLMSYDLHGIWDRDNPIGNQILGHTNITEIDLALDLFWRNDISPKDIVLGIGFYGRSFKLESSSCWKPGCRFSDPGDKGKCTNTAGFLSYREIMELISKTKAKPVYDSKAKVNYMVYGENNWISYDDERTFKDKIDFANSRGLNGLMMWAIDLDDEKGTALNALTGGKHRFEGTSKPPFGVGFSSRSTEAGYSSDDSSQCRISACGGRCTRAETLVGRVWNSCGGGPSNAKSICCPAWTSLTEADCHWDRGRGGVSSDCAGKCNPGEIKITKDKRGWKGDLRDGGWNGAYCQRGSQTFCCKAGNMKQYLDICTWTKCGGTCPSDKPNVLTVDSGGPGGEGERCNAHTKDNFMQTEFDKDAQDPNKGQKLRRKLCCPEKDSFSNCVWRWGHHCSVGCGNGQITLDLDPQAMGGPYCSNGRQAAFCCDAPGKTKQPFLPVDLDKIFPPEYLPEPKSIPQFELLPFGATGGNPRPNDAGVAFFLIAGSEKGLSSMSKRDNPNLHFLECPEKLFERPKDQVQTARVICTGAFEDCFGVEKGGVEGTVVHMPTECGAGSYARAVSLVPSQNQSIPIDIALKNPTSAVYDFSFDYNMGLVRRDAGRYSIRVDYSNVKGYWNSVVDRVGRKKRSLKDLVSRFYSTYASEWFTQFDQTDFGSSSGLNENSKSSLNQVIFFDSQTCRNDKNKNEGQGILITLQGTNNAEFYYGFSMIATWSPGAGNVEVHQSAGFLHVEGDTNAKFVIQGIGNLDSSRRTQGDTFTTESPQILGGHNLYHGWATFQSYKQEDVRFQTLSLNNKGVSMNGYLSALVKAKWGGYNYHFPDGQQSFKSSLPEGRGISGITPLTGASSDGTITVGVETRFGLNVDLDFGRPYQSAVNGDLPDMSVSQLVTAKFTLSDSDSQVCLQTEVQQMQVATLQKGAYVGWGKNYDNPALTKALRFDSNCFKRKVKRGIWDRSEAEMCHEDEAPESDVSSLDPTRKKTKRQNSSVPSFNYDYSGRGIIRKISDLTEEGIDDFVSKKPRLHCDDCGSCTLTKDGEKSVCCSCSWLPPPDGYDSDDLGIESDDGSDTGSMEWPIHGPSIPGSPGKRDLGLLSSRDLVERAGKVTTGFKEVSFWQLPGGTKPHKVKSQRYPAYPDFYRLTDNPAPFDGNTKYDDILQYYHNTTAVCTSFEVAKHSGFDRIYKYDRQDKYTPSGGYTQGKLYHQHYQTEHVFEGQTVGRFFEDWLDTNGFKHSESEKYALEAFQEWEDPKTKKKGVFVKRVIDELGSKDHMDRLAIFLTNSNGIKGRLFGGKTSMTMSTFKALDAGADQLLAARELGMIFSYMDQPEIWDAFCDTYNAMLAWMVKFDAFYLKEAKKKSDLAGEWPKFIRSELDMVVRKARADIKLMYQNRDMTAPAVFGKLWDAMVKDSNAEARKIKLERIGTCKNLAASTVPAYKF